MSEIKRLVLSGMQILINQKWQADQAVVVEDGKITAIIPVEQIKQHLPAEFSFQQCKYSSEHYLIPGFIDLHIHGVGGHDVMDADVTALNEMSLLLAREGVTGFLATTMTADTKNIEAALQSVATAMDDTTGAAILGIHLEGPFIAKEKMGAQLGDKARDPDIDLFRRWQKLSGDNIKLVTLAPELKNALPFIQALRSANVIVSSGHTNATYEEAMAAVTTGSTYATHLFNAMRELHHREPGTVGAMLLADGVTAEIIADGKHLHPAMYKLALRNKGRDKLLLVTDAMRAKCMGEGDYDLGGQTVMVKAGKATLADGTLAGSVLTMPQAVQNMVEYSGCSLLDAIHMATYNPARKLNLISRKGSIEVGKDADLVVLSKDFNVDLTVCGGAVVFEKEKAVIARKA